MISAQDLKQLEEQETGWDVSQYSWDPISLIATPSDIGAGPYAKEPALDERTVGPVLVRQVVDPAATELRCQVKNCLRSLGDEKMYYRRYRVCKHHLNMLSIVVDGEVSRFCQQCGRFHRLTEFDGNKRSCRERLKQHNERRRKTVPRGEGPLKRIAKNVGHALTEEHMQLGLKMISSQESAQASDSFWIATSKFAPTVSGQPFTGGEDGAQQPAPASSPLTPLAKDVLNCFAAVNAHEQAKPQPLRSTVEVAQGQSQSALDILAEWEQAVSDVPVPSFPPVPSQSTDSALLLASLMSTAVPSASNPWQTDHLMWSMPLGMDPTLPACLEVSATLQSDPHGIDYLLERSSEPFPCLDVPEATSFAIAPLPRSVGDQCSPHLVAESLRAGGQADHNSMCSSCAATLLTSESFHNPGALVPCSTQMGGEFLSDMSSFSSFPSTHFSSVTTLSGSASSGNDMSALQGSHLGLETQGLDEYSSQHSLVRLTMKIYDCAPEQLPAEMRMSLHQKLLGPDRNVLQGYLRQGCVHVTLEMLLTEHGPQASLPGLADFASILGPGIFQCKPLLVQLDGRPPVFFNCAEELQLGLQDMSVPVADLRPLVLHSGAAAVLKGSLPLLQEGSSLLVRSAGAYLPYTRVLDQQGAVAGVQLAAEDLPPCGLLRVEGQHGVLLGSMTPVLVMDDPDVVDELRELEHQLQHRLQLAPSTRRLLTELGLLLEMERLVMWPHSPPLRGWSQAHQRSSVHDSVASYSSPASTPRGGSDGAAEQLTDDLSDWAEGSGGGTHAVTTVDGTRHSQQLLSGPLLDQAVAMGSNVLAFCVGRGWCATARRVLAALEVLLAPAGLVLANVEALPGGGGLLTRARQSGKSEMVALVQQWAEDCGSVVFDDGGAAGRLLLPSDGQVPSFGLLTESEAAGRSVRGAAALAAAQQIAEPEYAAGQPAALDTAAAATRVKLDSVLAGTACSSSTSLGTALDEWQWTSKPGPEQQAGAGLELPGLMADGADGADQPQAAAVLPWVWLWMLLPGLALAVGVFGMPLVWTVLLGSVVAAVAVPLGWWQGRLVAGWGAATGRGGLAAPTVLLHRAHGHYATAVVAVAEHVIPLALALQYPQGQMPAAARLLQHCFQGNWAVSAVLLAPSAASWLHGNAHFRVFASVAAQLVLIFLTRWRVPLQSCDGRLLELLVGAVHVGAAHVAVWALPTHYAWEAFLLGWDATSQALVASGVPGLMWRLVPKALLSMCHIPLVLRRGHSAVGAQHPSAGGGPADLGSYGSVGALSGRAAQSVKGKGDGRWPAYGGVDREG